MNAEPKTISPEAVKEILSATQFALKRNGGKDGGWASKQQVDAIMAAIAAENGSAPEDYDGTVLKEVVSFFANASATAQYMEKHGVIAKRAQRGGAKPNIFAGFSS